MIIYKKDTKGNIRYIKAYTVGAELIQESGIVGTENPLPYSKICKGKNIGRANETTGAEQAIKERDSLIAEKLKKEYFNSIKEAEEGDVVLPMLAKKYKEGINKVDWTDAYIQRKYDGMRCLAFCNEGKVKLISRENGEIGDTVPHIVKQLSKVKGEVILDGELFVPGTFQENMKAIKGESDKSSEVCFNVYDLISKDGFAKRSTEVATILLELDEPNILLVETIQVANEIDIKAYHKQFLGEGYEGTILRWGKEPYGINKRSFNLLKFKDFIDKAYKIVDIIACDDRPLWGKPVFIENNGKRFEAGMKYSHKERIDFLKNKDKYIGKIAEVRFFEYTDSGIPRFPVMYGIRLDKTKQDKK